MFIKTIFFYVNFTLFKGEIMYFITFKYNESLILHHIC